MASRTTLVIGKQTEGSHVRSGGAGRKAKTRPPSKSCRAPPGSLEHQVEVMRVGFRRPDGCGIACHLVFVAMAPSACWLGLTQGSEKTNEPRRIMTRTTTGTLTAELLPFGELALFRVPLQILDVQINIERSTEVAVAGTKVSGLVDPTGTMHTSQSQSQVGKSHVRFAGFLQVNVLTSLCWHE